MDNKSVYKDQEIKIKTASLIGSFITDLIDRTGLRKKHNYNQANEPAIYATWHGSQLGFGVFTKKERKNIKLHILISQSNDGDIISNVSSSVGFSTIRGSLGRGGAKALRDMVSILKNDGNIAYTVDGPKGPLYEVKDGLIKVAQLSGRPIIPMMVKMNPKITFKSWDNYELPLLFSLFEAEFGDPIHVPRKINEEEHENYKQQVKQKLFELNEKLNNKKIEKR